MVNKFIVFFILKTVNFVIMKALERYDYFYDDSFKVEFPTGSGNMMRLKDTSVEIATRLSKLFIPDANGQRPCHGDDEIYWKNKNWSDEILFYEFFDGCTGRGCGARYRFLFLFCQFSHIISC